MQDSLETAAARPDPQLLTRVGQLIARLESDDAAVRRDARTALEAVGRAAVAPLVRAASAGSPAARKGVLRALRALADPSTTPVLMAALEGEDSECRWIAAEALVALGRPGLVAVLERLALGSDPDWQHRCARHVLHGLSARGFASLVRPVLDALAGETPEVDVPRAAHLALETLRRPG